MSRVAHVRTHLRPTDSPSEVYTKMAEAVPRDVLLVFGLGIIRELRQELKSWNAVTDWAVELARRLDRPVLLNFPNGADSRTVALAPDWSQERLAGYLAGRHEELATAFGPIAQVTAGGAT